MYTELAQWINYHRVLALGDSAYPFRQGISHFSVGYFTFHFTNDHGTNFEVEIEESPNALDYFTRTQKKKAKPEAKAYVINFSDRDELDEIGKTGKGDAFKVFSTVLAVLKHFIAKNPQTAIIEFTALKDHENNSDSRQTLYKFYADLIHKKILGWKNVKREINRGGDYTATLYNPALFE